MDQQSFNMEPIVSHLWPIFIRAFTKRQDTIIMPTEHEKYILPILIFVSLLSQNGRDCSASAKESLTLHYLAKKLPNFLTDWTIENFS